MDRLRCCVCWGLGALIAMSVGCADGAPRGDGRELDLEAWFRLMREKMVKIQIEGRGVKDQRVLEVMRRIPRHEFVPSHSQSRAYDDGAMPIGEGQTISQPYIGRRAPEESNGMSRGSPRISISAISLSSGSSAWEAHICSSSSVVPIRKSLASPGRSVRSTSSAIAIAS